MELTRSSGVILHPTSLPGPYGIGDLGPAAHAWVDWLATTGCGLWQVLPLGPTGYGDSPYQSFSAFAGNPYLVSPDLLADDGLLTAADLADRPGFPPDRVDYGAVIPWKLAVLDRAYARFAAGAAPGATAEMELFRDAQSGWLEDYALFMALKDAYGGGAWTDWPAELVRRDPDALSAAREHLAEDVDRHRFRQLAFFRQWSAVRGRANGLGLRIIGDAPIFVAHDSADVWAHPELFHLDGDGRPTVVAGVPPDYFSETGQLWGNPLYDWEAHAATGYAWWIRRLEAIFQVVDMVRIDHFRAFADYWEIPAAAPTAVTGRWVDGPGMDFFRAVAKALGDVPIIAEDLGELSPAVPRLLEATGLPGMRILQFAFDGDLDNEFLPHHYPEHTVAYTGTHDNDTTLGWFASAAPAEQALALEYLGSDGADIAGDMVAAVWKSPAAYALAPLQDLLRLGATARMNTPGRPGGNWSWRMAPRSLTPGLAAQLHGLNARSGRLRRGAIGP